MGISHGHSHGAGHTHDDHTHDEYVEPRDSDAEGAGGLKINVPLSPYEKFMESEAIPVHDGRGFHDLRDVELGDWARLGGRGAYLCLDGATQLTGVYVIEIPPGGMLEPEHHMFEKYYFVIEGRGTTEMSLPEQKGTRNFEWGEGALFAIPMNATHRLVNGTNRRALLVAGTNAPPIINLFDNPSFVWDNPYKFSDDLLSDPNFFDPPERFIAAPETGRAVWQAQVLPDIVNCYMPLDNHRAPGFRRIEPRMGGQFFMFIAEYPTGRYSSAHYHESGAALLCIKGSGYTLNWPTEYGIQPWKSGNADVVETVEYTAGGIVAAAPGGGEWFHQHFGSSQEPLRTLAFIGGLPGQMLYGTSKGGTTKTHMNQTLDKGGNSIAYSEEDPFIRAEFDRRMKAVGVKTDMPERIYE